MHWVVYHQCFHEVDYIFVFSNEIFFVINLGGNDVWEESYGTEKYPFKNMLTFTKDIYKDFANKLRKLRKKCEEEIDYKHGFDSILEEIYAKPELVEEIMTNNHTVEQFYDVLKIIAPRYMSLVEKYYDFDGTIPTNKWKSDPRYWTNPLSTPLPNVTNLKIYCSKVFFIIIILLNIKYDYDTFFFPSFSVWLY